jgi:hypothetical protein
MTILMNSKISLTYGAATGEAQDRIGTISIKSLV